MLSNTSGRLMAVLLLVVLFLSNTCAGPQPQPEPETQVAVTPAGQASNTGPEVRVAVLAIRSAVAAQAQYGPILTYLTETMGRPFVFVPVGQEEQFGVIERGEVDFTFNNPLAAVQLRRLYDTRFLATLSRIDTGPVFSGLIIARNDSGIQTAEDLKGKRVTCVDFETAAAGCIFQVFHVLQAGIDPSTDFASFSETPSQDNIVLGVLNGTFDAGFVRTGQLEKMVEEGTLLNLSEITIVDQATDDFFYPHTTRLYPEWPFAALANTDPQLAERVQAALLALTPDHPAMINAGAVGFVPGIDYAPVDELIETLKLPSWEAPR